MSINSNYTHMDSNSTCDDYYRDFSKNVFLQIPPILLIFGTFGNVLSGLVMLRPKLRRNTTCVYLGVLACVDMAILYTGLGRYWVKALTGTDIRDLSPVVCKGHVFLVYFLVDLEAWILVSVAVERMVAVCSPAVAKKHMTRRFALVQLSILTCIMFCINAHYFWTLSLPGVINDPGGLCGAGSGYEQFLLEAWPTIDTIIACLLPFSILLMSNLRIIITLYRRKRRRYNQRLPGAPPVGIKLSGITAMLLLVCTVFFICIAPIEIELLRTYLAFAQNDTHNCDSSFVALPLLNMLMYVNYVINFWLYCVSAPLFRTELRKMVTCHCP